MRCEFYRFLTTDRGSKLDKSNETIAVANWKTLLFNYSKTV